MTVSDNSTLPRHISIIMDGNGRWAKKRFLPRFAGHKAGVDAVRRVIKYCAEKGIEVLSLFAFSSENWRRPAQEVDYLMGLFISALEKEAKKLDEQNIQLRIIGERSRFEEKLQNQIQYVEALTQHNTGLKLVIAANYGGHWEICEVIKQILREASQQTISLELITPDFIQQKLLTSDIPNPDLLIRTSGEQRISNFMLWQLAYSELYFTDILWPDFSETDMDLALEFYTKRERRFGLISEQLGV